MRFDDLRAEAYFEADLLSLAVKRPTVTPTNDHMPARHRPAAGHCYQPKKGATGATVKSETRRRSKSHDLGLALGTRRRRKKLDLSEASLDAALDAHIARTRLRHSQASLPYGAARCEARMLMTPPPKPLR